MKKFLIIIFSVIFSFVFINESSVNASIQDSSIIGLEPEKTMAKISREYYENSETIILVNENSLADMISATNIQSKKAAILICKENSIKNDIFLEIKRLNPKKIIIMGGEKTISMALEKELRANYKNVLRIGGKDRYATNLKTLQKDKMISIIDRDNLKESFMIDASHNILIDNMYSNDDISKVIKQINPKKFELMREFKGYQQILNKIGVNFVVYNQRDIYAKNNAYNLNNAKDNLLVIDMKDDVFSYFPIKKSVNANVVFFKDINQFKKFSGIKKCLFLSDNKLISQKNKENILDILNKSENRKVRRVEEAPEIMEVSDPNLRQNERVVYRKGTPTIKEVTYEKKNGDWVKVSEKIIQQGKQGLVRIGNRGIISPPVKDGSDR